MFKYFVSVFTTFVLASCAYAPAMAANDVHTKADQLCTRYSTFIEVVEEMRKSGSMAKDIITTVNERFANDAEERGILQQLVILTFDAIPDVSNEELRAKMLRNTMNRVYLSCYTAVLNDGK